jgi:hypothetical protein
VANPLDIDSDRAYYALAEAVKGAGHALVAWWKHNQDVPIDQVIELNRRLIWNGLGNMIVEGFGQAAGGTAEDGVEGDHRGDGMG